MRDCLLAAASRELAFFWQQKKARKENCRCFDAADPRLRGCTPLRTPKRKSEGPTAKRKQYYFSFLTPPPLPPPLSRVFPRTPDAGNSSPLGPGRPGPRLCYATHQRATSAHCKRGGLPPSLAPLVRKFSQQSVGAGHARPAALRQLPVSFCIPFIFYIVGRGCGVANRGHG